MQSTVKQLLSCLLVLITLQSWATGQDAEQVKQRILTSLAKIENYSSGVLRGWIISRRGDKSLVHFHFRGDKMWRELDQSVGDDEVLLKRNQIAKEVMGTKDFLFTAAYDGKTLYEFSPAQLTLKIQNTARVPGDFSESVFLPKNWLWMGANRDQTFRRLVENKKYEVKVEKLDDHRWKLSQSNLGSLNPPDKRNVAIRDRFIVVDERYDFLVTEYFGEGAQGRLEGTLEWEKQDGYWYAKRGKHMGGGKRLTEWEISEVSFDATKCRSRFNDLESIVPFATKIETLDENYKEIAKPKYVGGSDGEVEYKLRELSLLKRKKEGT